MHTGTPMFPEFRPLTMILTYISCFLDEETNDPKNEPISSKPIVYKQQSLDPGCLHCFWLPLEPLRVAAANCLFWALAPG